ncbi:AraC family transcriptional regulator, partial [Salmonella enterica]|nr:AraC family transcriptional regulator [Salmonella enterica]ECJ8004936.1 AraC family transcriptional regulator [Salmonella enterica]EDC2100588.1 AraC family transcriptional regulator [Salmonella enterica]EEL0037396.1 AraC family transcriptional regulator [Salmonella enterica]
MEKIRQAFLSSNSSIDFIEYCSCPYIILPCSQD